MIRSKPALRAQAMRWLAVPALVLAVSCEHGSPVEQGRNPGVALVRIQGDSLVIPLLEARLLVAVANDGDGREIVGAHVRWTSSDTTVIQVTDTLGTVLARGLGQATVTATVDSCSATVPIRVREPDPRLEWVNPPRTGVVGEPLTDSLAVRLTEWTGKPIAGEEIEIAVQVGDVRLSRGVGLTGADGILRTAVTMGTTARWNSLRAVRTRTRPQGDIGIGLDLFSIAGPAVHIDIAPDSLVLAASAGAPLSAKGVDRYGNEASLAMTYRSLDAAIASVTGRGYVSGVGVGRAGIIGTDSVGGRADTVVVRVGEAVTAAPLDDSRLPDSLRIAYLRDAGRLALREQDLRIPVSEQAVELPATLVQQMYGVLVRIWASTSAGRDSATDVYHVHTYPWPETRRLIVRVDTLAAWADPWRQNVAFTGVPAIDSLVNAYGLTVTGWSRLRGLGMGDMILLQAADPLNARALAARFDALPIVLHSEADGAIGGGMREIQAIRQPDGWQVGYSLNWGDCPAGCINHHTWSFFVSDAGAVRYLGVTGPPYPEVPGP